MIFFIENISLEKIFFYFGMKIRLCNVILIGDGKITFEEMVVVTVKRREHKDTDADIKRLFKRFDTDGDGVLSRSELVKVLKALGDKLLVADIDELMEDFDENHDGVIQYDGK